MLALRAAVRAGSAVAILVRKTHEESGGTWGYPKIYRRLRDAGYVVGERRVRIALKKQGLRGLTGSRSVRLVGRAKKYTADIE
jgi:repressor of nif and glnA expression